jgi:membrane peptidoglycan carboxypeptidase
VSQTRTSNHTRRKKRQRRLLPSWKLVAWVFALGFLGVVGVVAVAYVTTDIPTPNAFATQQSTTYYYADGTTPITTEGEQNRVIVPLSKVPQHVQHAVIAAENRSFYEDSGISPTGIVRAAINNLRGTGGTQGGSTITQQYAKNYYLTQERSWERKIREIFLSVKLDRQYTKDQILQDYLNTIYFGRGAYGIQAAAQTYFGVDVDQLTVDQGAVLAQVIRAPSYYDPETDPQRAEARFRYVLSGMAEQGWLGGVDPATVPFPAIRTKAESKGAGLGGQTGYLWQAARQDLLAKGALTEEDLLKGGYRVITTFEKPKQEAAVEAVEGTLDELQADTPDVHAALAAVRPGDGAVVAAYGGRDFVTQGYNDALQGTVQAGSTFKPFTLAAALENGIGLRSRFNGENEQTFEGYLGDDGEPKPVLNFDDASFGNIDLIRATANSVNTVYVQLALEVGPDKVLDAAQRAGIPETTGGLLSSPSVTLGPSSPHPIDMASAYATFAAQGMRTEPYVVSSITTYDGASVWSWKPEPLRVFDEGVTADLTYAMQQVVEQGSGKTARALDRPVAGKTGTSQENKSAWFAGFTPQLSAAVALFRGSEGTEVSLEGVGGRRSVTGGSFPTTIWTDFMEAALADEEVLEFPDPEWVGKAMNPEPTREPEPDRDDEERDREQEPEPEPEPTQPVVEVTVPPFVPPPPEFTFPPGPGRPDRPTPAAVTPPAPSND